MLVALKPRLPGNWKPTLLATTNTTATASCSSIVHPLDISFLIDVDIFLPLDFHDRSMLVASTHCCQHPSTTTTYISNVCHVPPTTTHSFIVILNYKPRLMPPTNVNGLTLAASHLHLPIYFLQLLQFLTKIRSLPHFVPSTFLPPTFYCLLPFVPRPSIDSSFLAHLLSLILHILAPHLLLGIVCAGTSDNIYLSICTLIFNYYLLPIVTPMLQFLYMTISTRSSLKCYCFHQQQPALLAIVPPLPSLIEH